MNRRARGLQIALGGVVLCVIWEVLGQTKALGITFPPLSLVLVTLFSPQRFTLFSQAIGATATSAALGMLIGGGVGILIAATRQTVESTRSGLDRLSATIHAIPQIGIAPVMIVLLGRENAPIAVASIAAFFPSYAASTRAFSTAAAGHEDLFTVLGSSRWQRLFRLELPAAIPGLIDALRLAAPGAVLGAVLGEWFGAPRGVGLLILSGSQNYDIPLLWSSALLSTIMAMIGFAAFSVLQKVAARRFS